MPVNKKQQIVVISAAAVMTAVFVFCGYLPLSSKVKTLRSGNEDMKILIDQRFAEISQIPAMRTRVSDLAAKVGNMNERIPGDRNIGDFLNSVAGIMQSCDLKEQLVQPSAEFSEGKLRCIPIELNCKGNLESMFNFFKSLRSSGRLIRIERIEFEGSDKLDGQIKMSTKGLIYYQPKAG